MTDILTKLAALTQTDDEGLLPCSCGSKNVELPVPYSKASWVRCKDCGLSTDEEASEKDAIGVWNNRPREATIIALVQEAAGEIGRLEKQFCILGEAVCSYDKRITEYFYKISTLEWAIGCKDKQILQFSEAINEQEVEIERIRKAAQNLIDTFKIGDDIVKDGVPRYVANAIATTALHQLNQALNPQEQPDA